MKTITENIRYNDLIFRILVSISAAHYIVSAGRYMSFLDLIRLKNYPVAMIASTCIAGIIIEGVFRITRFLDRRYPWESLLFKRLLKQVLYGVVIPLALAVVLASIYFAIFGVNIFETVYFSLYFPVIVLMILLLNAYYMIHYGVKFYGLYHQQDHARHQLQETGSPGDSVLASPENVVYIFCRKKVYFFISPAGLENIWPYNMAQTVDLLSPEEFIFIRRSFVVKWDNVLNVLPESSRRYRLILKIPKNKTVIVSQRYAREFKKLLKKSV